MIIVIDIQHETYPYKKQMEFPDRQLTVRYLQSDDDFSIPFKGKYIIMLFVVKMTAGFTQRFVNTCFFKCSVVS